jgi:hypothetical protein
MLPGTLLFQTTFHLGGTVNVNEVGGTMMLQYRFAAQQWDLETQSNNCLKSIAEKH